MVAISLLISSYLYVRGKSELKKFPEKQQFDKGDQPYIICGFGNVTESSWGSHNE